MPRTTIPLTSFVSGEFSAKLDGRTDFEKYNSGVKTLENFFKTELPEIKYTVAHGKLPAKTLEQRMSKFYDKKISVLISTNIIESGLMLSSVVASLRESRPEFQSAAASIRPLNLTI